MEQQLKIKWIFFERTPQCHIVVWILFVFLCKAKCYWQWIWALEVEGILLNTNYKVHKKISENHWKPPKVATKQPPPMENPRILMLSCLSVLLFSLLFVLSSTSSSCSSSLSFFSCWTCTGWISRPSHTQWHHYLSHRWKEVHPINVCSYSMFNRQSFQYTFIEFPFAIETCLWVCVCVCV